MTSCEPCTWKILFAFPLMTPRSGSRGVLEYCLGGDGWLLICDTRRHMALLDGPKQVWGMRGVRGCRAGRRLLARSTAGWAFRPGLTISTEMTIPACTWCVAALDAHSETNLIDRDHILLGLASLRSDDPPCQPPLSVSSVLSECVKNPWWSSY